LRRAARFDRGERRPCGLSNIFRNRLRRGVRVVCRRLGRVSPGQQGNAPAPGGGVRGLQPDQHSTHDRGALAEYCGLGPS